MALTLASTTAALAYLDAKFHIRKDINTLYGTRRAVWEYEAYAKLNKRSLWYRFEESARDFPDNIAVWSRESGDVKYRDLYTLTCRYATWMKDELGVRPGELVAFYLINSLEMIAAYLATWAIGAAPSMINYNLGGKGLLHCLSIGGSRVILVDEDEACQTRIKEQRAEIDALGIKVQLLDRMQKGQIAYSSAERPGDEWRAGVKDTDPTMMLFTSGTTGFPKACRYHVSRVWQTTGRGGVQIGGEQAPNPTRMYNPMPYYHGTGWTVTVMCLCAGMATCVGRKFSANGFWADVRDSKATGFVYVGETARYLLAQPPSSRDKDHNLQFMFGNGLRPDVWEKFQQRFGVERVSEFFNSTEGVLAFGNYNCRGDFFRTAVGHQGGLIRLLTHRVIIPIAVSAEDGGIIRDPNTGFATRTPYAVGGEMLVRVPGESVEESGFAGYYGNDQATSKRFVKDVFQKGDIFYRSGDALQRDNNGRWYFLDRLGDTYRWKSENVSTAEVSDVLGRFDGVVEANVYGVLVPGYDGRAGCAAIFLDKGVVAAKGGEAVYMKAVLAYSRQKLPPYAVPSFLRLVSAEAAGPQMHNNKQNKVPLREEGVDLDRIGRGTNGSDRMMWAGPGMAGYEPFTLEDWSKLQKGEEGGVRL